MAPPTTPPLQQLPVKKLTKKGKSRKRSLGQPPTSPKKRSKKQRKEMEGEGETVEEEPEDEGAMSTMGESIYEDFDA